MKKRVIRLIIEILIILWCFLVSVVSCIFIGRSILARVFCYIIVFMIGGACMASIDYVYFSDKE